MEQTKLKMEAAAARVEEEKRRVDCAKAAIKKNKKDLAAATSAVEKSAKEMTEEKKRCKIQTEETDESSSEDEGEAKPEMLQSDSQKSKIRYSFFQLKFLNQYTLQSLIISIRKSVNCLVFIPRVDMNKSAPAVSENTNVKGQQAQVQ